MQELKPAHNSNMKRLLSILSFGILVLNITTADDFAAFSDVSVFNIKTIKESKITQISTESHLKNLYLSPSENDWISPRPPQYDASSRTLQLEWKKSSVRPNRPRLFCRGRYSLSLDGKKLKIQHEYYEIQSPISTKIKSYELETNTPYCFKLADRILFFKIDERNNLIKCFSTNINYPQEEIQLYPNLTGEIIGLF